MSLVLNNATYVGSSLGFGTENWAPSSVCWFNMESDEIRGVLVGHVDIWGVVYPPYLHTVPMYLISVIFHRLSELWDRLTLTSTCLFSTCSWAQQFFLLPLFCQHALISAYKSPAWASERAPISCHIHSVTVYQMHCEKRTAWTAVVSLMARLDVTGLVRTFWIPEMGTQNKYIEIMYF